LNDRLNEINEKHKDMGRVKPRTTQEQMMEMIVFVKSQTAKAKMMKVTN
jgi:hypothetical protein